MRVTEAASAVILSIMDKKKLDPNLVAFELKMENGVLGFAFNRESIGAKYQFGRLTVIVDGIDVNELVIDLTEIGGKKGIIFLGEDQCQSQLQKKH